MKQSLPSTEEIGQKWFKEKLSVLIMDVQKQIGATFEVLEENDKEAIQKIVMRDDYIDNLKAMIGSKCFWGVVRADPDDHDFINQLKAIQVISGNLENVADFSVNIAKQTEYLLDKNFVRQHFEYKAFFEEVQKALALILDALFQQDLKQAIEICRCEFVLDALYTQNFKQVIQALDEKTTASGNLVTALFIFHYLERMGDSILNIGEAIISAVLGGELKIHQVNGLSEMLQNYKHTEISLSDIEFKSIWGTRSGCRIGAILTHNGHKEGVFKEGEYSKLAEEKDNIQKWDKIKKGLAPEVLGFETQNQNATILLEYLKGSTFKDLLIDHNRKKFLKAFSSLKVLLLDVWEKTFRPEPVKADFMAQLVKRLDDIYFVHGEFDKDRTIGDFKPLSFKDAIAALQQLEQVLSAPFSIFIHGDFNSDNIIFNAQTGAVHFVDLYRSKQGDLVQDVSVFLISNFRMPIFRGPVRDLLNEAMLAFLSFACEFARKKDDIHLEARLALGLVRSFVTSTRFELRKDFAKEMFLRARFLMDHLLQFKGEWSDYRLPEKILIYP